MTLLTVVVSVDKDSENYLESSARMRGVSRTMLVKRTIELVLRDQLLLSILDDGDAPGPKTALTRKRRGQPRDMPPRDHLFDALITRHSVPTRKSGGGTIWPRNADSRTRAEMEADLRQAIVNTGGVLVDE